MNVRSMIMAAAVFVGASTHVSAAPSKGGGGSLSIDYLLMLALVLIIQERAHWARKRKA